jgi:hypothetical protein
MRAKANTHIFSLPLAGRVGPQDRGGGLVLRPPAIPADPHPALRATFPARGKENAQMRLQLARGDTLRKAYFGYGEH